MFTREPPVFSSQEFTVNFGLIAYLTLPYLTLWFPKTYGPLTNHMCA